MLLFSYFFLGGGGLLPAEGRERRKLFLLKGSFLPSRVRARAAGVREAVCCLCRVPFFSSAVYYPKFPVTTFTAGLLPSQVPAIASRT